MPRNQPLPDQSARTCERRERRAFACEDCGLIEVRDDDVTQCPSCGEPVERLRTITRRECEVCGLVEPYIEYDGRFIANGLCAHRAWGEAIYVQMQVPTPTGAASDEVQHDG